MSHLIRFSLVAFLVLPFASPVLAATYYADWSRPDDSASCLQASQSPATAKKHIAAAVACATAPGDDVQIIGDGVQYNEARLPIQPAASGTSGQFISIGGYQAAPGVYHMPIVCGVGPDPAGDSNPAIATAGQSWIRFHHLQACAGLGAQLSGPGVNNVVLDWFVSPGRPACCTGAGNPSVIYISGGSTSTTTARNITVSNCTVRGATPTGGSINPENYRLVFIDHSDGVEVRNCDFGGPYAGVGVKHGSSNVWVHHNYFHGLSQYAFQTTQDSGTIDAIRVEHNVIVGNPVVAALNPTCSAAACADWTFANNTIVSGTWCLKPNFAVVPTGAFRWTGNICYLTSGQARYVDYGDFGRYNATDQVHDANVYVRGGGAANVMGLWRRPAVEGADPATDYNFAGWQSLGYDPHGTVTLDPHLRNAAGTAVTDFRSTDPPSTGVWVFAGGAAAGAWSTPDEVIGPGATAGNGVPPAAPTNLRISAAP